MGDEIMKAYTCGARAIFVEPPEKCPLLKDGNCEDGTPCDAAEVEVLPAAEYEAMEAALKKAEDTLVVIITDLGTETAKIMADEALARLRALGKG